MHLRDPIYSPSNLLNDLMRSRVSPGNYPQENIQALEFETAFYPYIDEPNSLSNCPRLGFA